MYVYLDGFFWENVKGRRFSRFLLDTVVNEG
jgi:hypothetical protein